MGRSQQRLNYFREKNKEVSGICSAGKAGDKDLKKETLKRIYLEIIKMLESGEKSSRELVAALPFPEKAILKILQLLLEKGIVELTKINTYKINIQ